MSAGKMLHTGILGTHRL